MSYEEDRQEVQELGMKTAKRGIIYLGGEVATSLITLILLILLARMLQPTNYGFYSIAIAFSSLLALGSTFGIGYAFRKMLPEYKATSRDVHVLLSNGYIIAAAVGLVVGAIGVILSSPIAQYAYGNPALTLALELAAVAEFFSVLFNLGQAATVGLHMVKEATVSNMAYSIFSLIGAVGLVLLGYGVPGAVAGMIIGMFAGYLVGNYYLIKRIGFVFIMPTRKSLDKLTAFSAPVVASSIATYGAQYFAIMFLGLFTTAAIVGNFGAAWKLSRSIEIGVTAITFVILPAFSTALQKSSTAKRIGAIYNRSLYYTALILFPFIAFVIADAKPLLDLMFSANYTTAPFYFAFMAAGLAIGLIGTYAGTLVVGEGDTKRFMRYQIIAVVIQLVLLFVLTPTLQALGALIALYGITPIVLNVLYIRALEKQFKIKHAFGDVLRVGAASFVLVLALYGVALLMNFSNLSVIVDIVLSLVLYPLILGMTGAIHKSQLEFIRGTAERIKWLRALIELVVRYTELFVRVP